jgi:peptide deformylase
MAAREILLLGDRRLHQRSEAVDRGELAGIEPLARDLLDTILDFRRRYGRGRAIAAPQVGVFKRVICMQLDQPRVLINPALSDLSDDMMTLWDDCMSFPDLLVRVRRHRSCTVTYRDLEWNEITWSLEDDLSELIQHEYDHLDGTLATQRALDDCSFALAVNRHLLK